MVQSRHSIGEEEESQVGGLPGLYDEYLPQYFHFHLPTQYCPHKGMLSWYYLFFVAHGGNTGKIMACVEDALTLRTQSLQGHISAHNSASLPLSHPRSCACLSTPKFALCHCHLSACPLWNPTCSIRII